MAEFNGTTATNLQSPLSDTLSSMAVAANFNNIAQVCATGQQYSTGGFSHPAAATPSIGDSIYAAASAHAVASDGIASFGFTQEQVACVCEVLEQSANIDRLAR